MDQKTADQAWRDMEARIEQLLPRFLSGEIRHLDYKPGSEVLLLDKPAERGRKKEGSPRR